MQGERYSAEADFTNLTEVKNGLFLRRNSPFREALFCLETYADLDNVIIIKKFHRDKGIIEADIGSADILNIHADAKCDILECFRILENILLTGGDVGGKIISDADKQGLIVGVFDSEAVFIIRLVIILERPGNG